MTPLWLFLKSVKFTTWVIVVLCLFVVYQWLALQGASYRIDAAQNKLVTLQHKVEAANKAAEEATAGATSDKVKIVTEYVDRIKIVKEKGDVIEKQVPVYIPVGTPDLPGGFRLLHDAAATNSPVAEGVSGDAFAAAPVADVAVTVSQNYTSCHVAYARVQMWESYYSKLCERYGCK